MKRTKRSRKSHLNKNTHLTKSFTLVEILLALVVLGIGLVSILSLFAIGMNSVRHVVASTEASFIAQMTFAECRLVGYDNLTSIGSTIKNSQNNDIYQNYSRALTIDPVTGITNLSKVEVRVYGTGTDETFTTYITKYDV